jgi:hypothetical protein
VRPNVSLISWAAQFGIPKAQELAGFVVVTNINAGGRNWAPANDAVDACVQLYARNTELHSPVRELLAQWDLGLSDVRLHESENVTPDGQKKKRWHAFGVHRDVRNQQYVLPFSDESSGTKAAFMLLTTVLPVLDTGGLVVFDELESDLHPHMLIAFLDLFTNPDTNPHDAQIIFTCHATEVLRYLQKSQITLVEKDGLESHAWRLDSVEGVRIEDNRVAKYLAGAYGAVPRL